MAGRRIAREQVLAFRAAVQSLDQRRPVAKLLDVLGSCGVQDTPPGNADVSLAARLAIDAPIVEDAVEAKRLVLTWSLRGAPHLVAPEDFAVFTLGARPAAGTIEALWGQPEHALVEVERAMVDALGSEPRPKGGVSEAVTASLPKELAPWCSGCKVHHPNESIFRAAPLLGRLVLTDTAPVLLAKAKTWLGHDAEGDIGALRTELLLRYLRCYGRPPRATLPSGRAFPSPMRESGGLRWPTRWSPSTGTPRGSCWRRASTPWSGRHQSRGVRLLPAKDAFLQARDRDLLFPEPVDRKRVFPTLGGPGVVLHQAIPVGVWRGTAKGKRYQVTVTPFGRFTAAVLTEVEAEAERVAHVRGHQGADVVCARP